MKIAVLGAGGVFALYFADWMLKCGHQVIGIGRHEYPAAPFRGPDPLRHPNYRWKTLHIVRDFDLLKLVLFGERPDVIVNFAALAYATSWDQAEWYYATNTVAVARLAGWLQHEVWLKRFVQISTSELYGSCNEPATETSPLNPTSPYAVSKMAADLHLQMMFRGRGFPMNIIRPCNCYAPGQQLYRILPKAAWCAVNGKKLPLEGGGKVMKTYMHATDLACAVAAVIDRGALGEIYNCGLPSPLRISFLAELVADAAGLDPDQLVEEAPRRVGEDACYWLASDKLKALGWAPQIPLHSGVASMVAWARQFHDQLPAPTPFVLRE